MPATTQIRETDCVSSEVSRAVSFSWHREPEPANSTRPQLSSTVLAMEPPHLAVAEAHPLCCLLSVSRTEQPRPVLEQSAPVRHRQDHPMPPYGTHDSAIPAHPQYSSFLHRDW